MKFGQHIFYIKGILLIVFAEALCHPVHKSVRGHQQPAQILGSNVISEKVALATIQPTTEKGQKRVVYVLLSFNFNVNPNQFKSSGNHPISTLSALIILMATVCSFSFISMATVVLLPWQKYLPTEKYLMTSTPELM